MDWLTLARAAAEMGLLLAVCWPLAALLRGLASRGVGASAHTWLAVTQALIVASLLLPVVGRLLVREPAAPWAAVQVWASSGVGAGAAARVAVDAGARSPATSPPAAARALAPWMVSIASIVALGALSRIVRLTFTLTRLRKHLESLPVLRRIGRVRVVASHDAAVAYSARVGGRAWVVIPAALAVRGSRRRIVRGARRRR